MWDVKVVDMRCKWCSFAFIAYYLYIAYIAIAYYLYIQPTQNIPFANCYTLHISVPVKTTNLELMWGAARWDLEVKVKDFLQGTG